MPSPLPQMSLRTCAQAASSLVLTLLLVAAPHAGAADPTPETSATAPATAPAAPDGMGHLPGQDHAGMAGHESADTEPEGEACAMDMHHAHAMHGHGHGHGHDGLLGEEQGEHCEGMDIAMHHPHGMMAPQMDAVLAAVAAPAPPAWLADLALTEAQEDRIFDVLHEVAPAQRKAQRVATRTLATLKHIGMATDYNEAETHKIADQHAQAVSELARLAARVEHRILQVLSPEQRRDAAHRAARLD